MKLHKITTCLFGIIAIIILLFGCKSVPPDQEEFEFAKEYDDIISYIGFLKKYPESQFADDATQRLEELLYEDIPQNHRNEIGRLKEFLLFDATDPILIQKAKQRLVVLEKRKEGDEFNEAIKSVDIEILSSFLGKYPDSIYTESITRRMESINSIKKALDNDPRLSVLKIGMSVDEVNQILGQPDEPYQRYLSLTENGFSTADPEGAYHVVKEGKFVGYIKITCSSNRVKSIRKGVCEIH